MKRLGFLVAAVAALAVGMQPAVASAAQAKLPPITAKAREQGKAEAPDVVKAGGIPCSVSDAYLIQSSTDAKTKTKTSLYEVACTEGPGYVVQAVGDKVASFDCLAQEETAKRDPKNGGLTCRLDPNVDAKAGFAKLVSTLGYPCTASGARIMGATAAGDTFYEIACEGDHGVVLQTSVGKPPQASDCIQTLGGGATECTLTSRAQIMNVMTKLAQPSGKNCTVSDTRMIGQDKNSGSTYYEVACGSSAGFMVEADAKGAFKQAIDCNKAQSIAGGCTLTVVDETAEAGTYTKLANTAGFPCEVAKYRYLGKEPKSNSEIVEVACKNRPDGGIGQFPISGAKGQVFDCVQGGSLGVTCQLSQPNVVYSKYTDRLVAQGKNQCKVSGAKFLASTNEGSDFIETACSDGLPGFVISIDHASGKTKELLTCGQVARSGAACTLPTNMAKN